MGGLLYAAENKMNLDEMLKLAAACGAANTMRSGAGLLHKKDVIRLKEAVTLKKIGYT